MRALTCALKMQNRKKRYTAFENKLESVARAARAMKVRVKSAENSRVPSARKNEHCRNLSRAGTH